MGYDVHITRADDWLESSLNPISMEEWKEVVDNDSEMQLTGEAYTSTTSGETIGYENEGLSVWKGKEQEKEEVWFDFKDGQIDVKNPDEEILIKMCIIAEKLKAKVLGDDGEEYYIEVDDADNKIIKIDQVVYETKEKRKSFLKKLFGLWK